MKELICYRGYHVEVRVYRMIWFIFPFWEIRIRKNNNNQSIESYVKSDKNTLYSFLKKQNLIKKAKRQIDFLLT